MKNSVLYWIAMFLFSQACSKNQFEHKFNRIPETGVAVPLSGKINIDQAGGHLQGIQLYEKEDKSYLFMSGSSSEVAFMVKAELDGKARILRADTLLLAPYRHAGGFQIHDRYLAVGIEDNRLRNTSRVMVYDLEGGSASWADPLQVIRRDGDYERVTAGAVGITEFNEQFLVAVANWDSRNLDFYLCSGDEFVSGTDRFRFIDSLDMARVSRENWSDPAWNSYQNINLFSTPGDELYLVGLATNGDGANVADLYKVQINGNLINNPGREGTTKANESISITKLSSKKFESAGDTSFRSGAGLFLSKDGQLSLFVCPEHIDQNSIESISSIGTF